MSRIKTPIRSLQCKHLQCFDINTALQINKSNRWKCLVCSIEGPVSIFFIDEFFREIIENSPRAEVVLVDMSTAKYSIIENLIENVGIDDSIQNDEKLDANEQRKLDHIKKRQHQLIEDGSSIIVDQVVRAAKRGPPGSNIYTAILLD